MDNMTEFILLDRSNRSGELYNIIQQILTTAFKPALLENQNPVVTPITTEFRRAKKPSKKDIFARFVYENNNKDGKEPIDLTTLIKHMEYMFPESQIYNIFDVFRGIMEELHNEIVKQDIKIFNEIQFRKEMQLKKEKLATKLSTKTLDRFDEDFVKGDLNAANETFMTNDAIG